MRIFLACLVIVVLSAQKSPSFAQPNSEQYLNTLLNTDPLIDTASFVVIVPESPGSDADRNQSWRNWQIVENYTYGKDRGNLPMIADLKSLHPYFRDKISALIVMCKNQGIELAVVESYRTHAKQAEYFGMGRKYTRSKGGNSKHQYGLAVDVVPMVNGKAEWDNQALWRRIGGIGERLGLRWGGRWRSPYDPAHFEWSGGMTTTELAKGKLPALPHSISNLYPCLEEEITALQQSWEAWEAEQSVMASSATTARNAGTNGQE